MAGVPPFGPGDPPPAPPFFIPPDLSFPPVWLPPPPPPPPAVSPDGEVVMILVLGFVAFVLAFVYAAYRRGRALAAADAAAGARSQAQRPRLPGPRVVWQDDGRELRRLPCTRTANPPTARLPAFAYGRGHSPMRDVEEASASMCSVCLAAFRLGETVRLLPACLHLYHAECIDPWLDAHSTCPICRSDADPSTDVTDVAAAARRLPPPV